MQQNGQEHPHADPAEAHTGLAAAHGSAQGHPIDQGVQTQAQRDTHPAQRVRARYIVQGVITVLVVAVIVAMVAKIVLVEVEQPE